MVGLLFLGANQADKPNIGGIFEAFAGNIGFVNKLDGVDAFNASPHTLSEMAEFIGGIIFLSIFCENWWYLRACLVFISMIVCARLWCRTNKQAAILSLLGEGGAHCDWVAHAAMLSLGMGEVMLRKCLVVAVSVGKLLCMLLVMFDGD